MLSPAVRAAAAKFATSQLGKPATPAIALGYEVGYAAGFVAPRAEQFPLSGQREFLRVLAPYLAEGITVYHPRTDRYGLLRGLPATYTGQGEPLADVEFYADAEARDEGCGDITEPVGKVLPVLYGFEDLATDMLLPDGRRGVPAVEVAKLALGNPHFVKYEEPKTQLSEENLLVSFGKMDTPALLIGEGSWAMAWIDSDKDINPVVDQLGIINWLRAAHFAVGLAPHQYHRRQPGFDYASGGRPEAPACAHKWNCHAEKCTGCQQGKEVRRA